MKHLLRNIKGSIFWKRTLAFVMTAIVMAALLPMDVEIAKANEEMLSGNSQSPVHMTALSFIAQYTEEGAMISKDILNMPEEQLYLPSEGRIAIALTVQITNPASEITETNYVYNLPDGMVLTGQGTAPVLDSSGVEIGTMTTAETGISLRFNEQVLEHTDTTANLELYGSIPAMSAEGQGECTMYFPVLATNGSRKLTVTNSLASVNAASLDAMEEPEIEASGSELPVPEIVEAETILALAAGETDIFDNTTITLPGIELKASYKNEDGTTTVVELTQGDTFDIPYDADINMDLNFVLGDGTAISGDRTYTYRLPDTIRVDVEADHELENPEGTRSIGTVHISRDGTLTFHFDTNVIGTNQHVPFYVRFAGGFSQDMQEAGKHADIQFPTESGSFDIHVDTTDSNERKEDKEPGDVIIEKSGAQVITKNGQNYIEWTVALGLNGRESLDGVIHDALPTGLTYANIPGYPKVNQDRGKGSVALIANENGQIDIKVTDCQPWWRSEVKFCTYYNESIFGSEKITENTSATVNNTAVFNPSDGSNGVEATGSVRITPDMVQKSGSSIDSEGNITWTVTLNREKLNINGTTYTDTFGTGLKLVPGSISHSAGTLTENDGKFEIKFDEDITTEVTITYKTEVTDLLQSNYENKAKLTGGNYNVEKKAYVNGLTLLTKSCQDYNSITKTFTWRIVVNSAKQNLTNVAVEDTFNPNMMYFVSASEKLATDSNTANGSLKFHFDSLTTQKVITVVTRVNPDYTSPNEWTNFTNHVDMTSSMNPDKKIGADAGRYVQVSLPELIDKSGTIKGDGTIEWTVVVKKPQLTVEKMTVTDVLPADTAYLPGSFTIQNRYYDEQAVKRNPVVGTDSVTGRETITYELLPSDSELSRFFNQEFEIKYRTRITDRNLAEVSHSYTNDVEFTVDYEGDITVKDDATATATGVVGGALDKEYSYQGGRDYVDWTVRINGGRNNMSDIKNPRITDELADYFDYRSGTLYKVTENGRVEVPANQYKATCVNRRLVVQLPNIGSDCYEFVFRTYFNVTPGELEGTRISNHVSFVGDGDNFEKQSASIENVNFSSSSAGASIKREIRVLKKSTDGTPLAGARFELYLDGVCIGEAVSGEDGYAVFAGLQSMAGYTLRLQETEAPSGYMIDGTGETFITDYTDAKMEIDTTTGIRYYELPITNKSENETSQTGSITIQKVNEAGEVLSGAQFGLYQDVTDDAGTTTRKQLATRTTGADGKVTFTNLEAGTYYVKELKSPEGYTVNNRVITAVIADNGSGMETSYDGATKTEEEVEDKAAVGTLRITKVDSDTGNSLSGATFGLYADKLCSDRIAFTDTDTSGVAVFSNLELGRTYYYREDKAPNGYVSDYTVHAVTIGTGRETTNQVVRETVENVPARGNLVVKKVDNSVPAKPLVNVEFTLTPKGGGTASKAVTGDDGIAVFNNIPFGEYTLHESKGKDGYVVASDENVTIDHVGDTNVTVVNDIMRFTIRIVKQDEAGTPLAGAEFGLFTKGGIRVKQDITNEQGIIEFTDVVRGDYYIREIAAPEGYVLKNDKEEIAADSIATNGQIIEKTIQNQEENGSILIKKQDGDGHPLAGAEFTLYDANGFEKGQATSMTGEEARDAGCSEGDAIFTGLHYGTYYVRETKAPEGVNGTDGYVYQIDEGYYKVVVNSDTVVTTYVSNETTGSNTGGELIITNKKLNIIVPLISFKLKKVDSATGQALSGAVFELYKNGVGTGITQITDAEGMAYFQQISVKEDLTNTVYTVVEVATPTGYVSRNGKTVITLARNKGELTPYEHEEDEVLTNEEIKWAGGTQKAGTVTNDPIKGSIQITKTGTITTILLQNAEFTLYTDAACQNPVKISGMTNPVKTNASGIAVFGNLPVGTYYVKETKAPKGYALSDRVTRVVITSDVRQDFTYRDTPLNVSISKQAINGTEEIPGARLTVTKKGSSTPIDSWTSTTVPHKIPIAVLEAGATYILREQLAPDGYGYSEEIEFTVALDGSIVTGAAKNGQTIIMRDQPISLSVTKLDETGAVLTGAILAIYDKNNQEIDRWTSDTMAHRVELGKLAAPASGYNKYTLREISAPHGYEIAEEIEFAVGSDGKLCQMQGGSYVEFDGRITMQDTKKPNNAIYIRKLDGMTRLGLAGVTFELTNESDTTWKKIWDSNGRLEPITVDSALTGIFTLTEVSAPEGYVLAEPIQFRIVGDKIVLQQGTDDAEVNYAGDTLSVLNQRLTIRVRKQNGYGTVLNGAVLRLSEYNAQTGKIGTEIAEFTSNSAAAEVIDFTKLKANQTYILQELEAPEGYQLAEDIIFTLGEDGTITRADGVRVVNHTIIMQDDEAGLGIRKISLEDRSGLAGSTLRLTTRDDPFFTTQTWVSDGKTKTWDFIDFTPGCTYTLTEIGAPDGYAYADPITFTVGAEDNLIYVEDEVQPNRTVYIADGKIHLTVSKQDLYDRVEVPGAELAILDEAGNTIVSWVTGSTAQEVDTSRLIAGRDTYQEYILREVRVPNGYYPAADIHFAIDRDGLIYTVSTNASGEKSYELADENCLLMYEEPKFSISKQNIAGEEVPGATLTVTAKDDKGFTPLTWVSGEEPRYFEKGFFQPGVTYVLTETNAPAGYAYTESVEFRLDAEGNVYVNGEPITNKKVIMVDDLIMVYISKQDITNTKELPGAALVIQNEAGEIIYSFVSTNEPTLIPSEVFTAPKQGSFSYYTLTEITAPDGYEVAETIAFAIDYKGRVYVKNEQGEYVPLTGDTIVMLDYPNGTHSRPGVPKTGDRMPLALVILLGLSGLLGACITWKGKAVLDFLRIAKKS
ncbi:MAG: SpaA isopeptide-forming pilin-related protein [Bacteroides sp.]|nr:SpaA isopeptide-forming pilin-related protein [Bacteroides sp.]MCM1549834.1 SpaA isopeptide-forming pilin-related protein [Clostridium sp.]